MYSKELTIRRNNDLKRRHENIGEDGSIQIKFFYPTMLKFKKKGTKNRWETLEVFQIIITNYSFQKQIRLYTKNENSIATLHI